jgi:hypothetical protein
MTQAGLQALAQGQPPPTVEITGIAGRATTLGN